VTLVARLTDIQHRLDALARRHRVPGAALAIGLGDEVLDFGTGVANRSTGVEVTTDTVFQIGSNTKLFTTTLVMQLVDSGEVELDAPVRRYVPAFELAVPGAGDITVRHLLTHTSGIQGDHFEGFGRGDDAVEGYVESLKRLDLVHPTGEMWSYCNAGFTLAGHLVEKVAGVPYHEALSDRICRPLGLRRTTVLVEEMLAHRCAVGHVPGPDGQPVVPPVVAMEYASIPAGSRTVATAAELVRFVRMHLEEGRAPDGSSVLSEASVRSMQQVQFTRPPAATPRPTQGLGWMMSDWDGKRVIGHGGGTIGQLSFLQVIPEDELVVVLLTNSGTGAALWEDLGRWLFDTFAGVRVPSVPKPADPPPDLRLERYTGAYDRLGVRHDVQIDDGALVVHTEFTGAMAELQRGQNPPPARLRPLDDTSFVARMNGMNTVVTFLDFQRGRPRYIFTGRVARRTRTRAGTGRGGAN
jgi:CubicO group peptidase (beta-lactamase class C family)